MIEFSCPCGSRLRVGDDRAGQKCRCPDCGARLVVPGGAVLTVEDAGVREVAPEAPRPRLSCPTCGHKMGGEAVVCVQCGTNVETGERLSGGARDLLSVDERLRQREQVDRVPFTKLILDTLIRPHSSMETLRWQLSFPDQLVKMALFWALTLVAVGALHAVYDDGAAGSKAVHAPEPGGAAPDARTRSWKQRIDGVRFHLEMLPERPAPDTAIAVTITWDREPPGTFTVGVMPANAMGAERYVPLPPATTVELMLPDDGPANCQLVLWQTRADGGKQLHTLSPFDLARPAAADDAAAKPRKVVLGALVWLLITVASLLAWGVLLGVGAKVMVGRSDWVPLLAVLAFLQGVTHLGWLPFLPLSPTLGYGMLLVDFTLRFWQVVLFFIAILHLYDLDIRNAVVLVFFSGGLIYVALYFATEGKMGMPGPVY